jgi:hypothetical protein
MVLVAIACGEEPHYKSKLDRLKASLESANSIGKIQAWLAQPDATAFDHLDRSAWPPCITSLQPFGPPFGIEFIEDGGVRIEWLIGDAIGVDIFPPGRRPERSPMVKEDYYHYHAPYGSDSYIWMNFK